MSPYDTSCIAPPGGSEELDVSPRPALHEGEQGGLSLEKRFCRIHGDFIYDIDWDRGCPRCAAAAREQERRSREDEDRRHREETLREEQAFAREMIQRERDNTSHLRPEDERCEVCRKTAGSGIDLVLVRCGRYSTTGTYRCREHLQCTYCQGSVYGTKYIGLGREYTEVIRGDGYFSYRFAHVDCEAKVAAAKAIEVAKREADSKRTLEREREEDAEKQERFRKQRSSSGLQLLGVALLVLVLSAAAWGDWWLITSWKGASCGGGLGNTFVGLLQLGFRFLGPVGGLLLLSKGIRTLR